MKINKKETKRISLVIAILIIAWSIKSFLIESTSERAWESIALFVVLIIGLLLVAFSSILVLAVLRKGYDLLFGKSE